MYRYLCTCTVYIDYKIIVTCMYIYSTRDVIVTSLSDKVLYILRGLNFMIFVI
uniref:Uncharacterized protein n=1 Tax=Amphimedon queenslandica TaxID=400682 RepID=A0A1X7SEJ9_AMPQE